MSAHAILSPSSAKRWLTCPPSARLCEKLAKRFGDKATPYALEGTKAHTLAELKLRHANKEINDFNFKTRVEALGDIPSKMDRATDEYADIVISKLYAAGEGAQLLIEQRLDMSPWAPKCFGTGDAVILSDRIIEVIDYKNGQGVVVKAEGNPQARFYGLGALNGFGSLYDAPLIRNTIVQPNIMQDPVTEETLTREELLAWGDSIKPAAELAWEGKGEFRSGDHCRFCLARAICATRASEAMRIFEHGLASPGLIDDADIPEILSILPAAREWISDLEEYALNQAKLGQVWPGWKLVEGRRGKRTFRNAEAAREQLIRAGYNTEDFEETKLKNITEIEKLLGKTAFRALLGSFVTQPEGAPTLAPEDDTRHAVSSAKTDFSDLAD